MKVDIFHRHDLSVAATRRSTLHTETWSQAGFAQADDSVLADSIKRVAEADSCRCLALPSSGRRHGSHKNQLCVRPLFQLVEVIERDFRFEVAVQKEVAKIDSESTMADLRDRQHVRFLSDFDVGLGVLVLVVHGVQEYHELKSL